MKLSATLTMVAFCILAIGFVTLRAQDAKGQQDETPVSAEAVRLPEVVAEEDQAICLGKQNFQGCCSKQTGVKGFDGERIVCRDEQESPSCSAEAISKIRGCCSSNDGFDYAELNGTVYCKSGRVSSCTMTLKRTSSCD